MFSPCSVAGSLKDTPLYLHSFLEKAWAVPVLELQLGLKGISSHNRAAVQTKLVLSTGDGAGFASPSLCCSKPKY